MIWLRSVISPRIGFNPIDSLLKESLSSKSIINLKRKDFIWLLKQSRFDCQSALLCFLRSNQGKGWDDWQIDSERFLCPAFQSSQITISQMSTHITSPAPIIDSVETSKTSHRDESLKRPGIKIGLKWPISRRSARDREVNSSEKVQCNN
jgi:hypothetical protein